RSRAPFPSGGNQQGVAGRVRRTYIAAPTKSIAPIARPNPTPASCQPKPESVEGSAAETDETFPCDASQDESFSGATSAPPICTSRGECDSPAWACQDESFSGATSAPPIWTRRVERDWPACTCQDDSCAGATCWPPI